MVATTKEKKRKGITQRVDEFIIKYTPKPVKTFFDKLVSILPDKIENWIRSNRFLAICIVYSIRGLFFRPSMWLLYASIAAYFGYK